ncbi:MAG: Crp/Fnr family transcriptional regulator [Rhodospirillaceae bacterium]
MTAAMLRNHSPCDLHVRGQNRLLNLLPEAEREALSRHMQKLALKQGLVLQEPGSDVPHVYFPLDCIVSQVLHMEDGAVVEVGTIGNEGIVGLSLVLSSRQGTTTMMAQVPGDAYRICAEDLRTVMGRRGALSELLLRYAQAHLALVAQTAACNSLHQVDQRLCRWILMTHDRIGLDRLPLTQEFLGMMLGVRRGSVNIAAGMLQTAGLINYKRGVIEVLDRAGLEAAACECYAAVRKEMERLLC